MLNARDKTHISLRVQFDKKSPALETQLPYLGPGERVDADEVLKDDNSHVNHRQMKSNAVMILHHKPTSYLHHASQHPTASGSSHFTCNHNAVSLSLSLSLIPGRGDGSQCKCQSNIYIAPIVGRI